MTKTSTHSHITMTSADADAAGAYITMDGAKNDTSAGTCGHSECLDTVFGIEYEENPHDGTGGSKPTKKSGIFGACSNLVNYIVGAGIIGMPYAMKCSGLITGIFLLALVGWMTDKSLRMLVDLANFHPKLRKLNVHSYEDLMSFPFGKIGSNFILANMFVIAFGALVAYLLIIKDTLPPILGLDNGAWQREMVLVVASLVVIVPLSMQRDMSSLAFTSLLSVTADIALIIFIAFAAPIKETVSAAGGFGEVLKHEWFRPSTSFIGLGVLSCAMTCQHAAFIIGGSLANRTRARWAAVTYRSISISAVSTGVIGVCGYLGYLEDTQGDILNNFDPDSVAANVARGLLAFTMFFTYPMESYVARHVIIKIVHRGDMDGGEEFAEKVEDNALPGWKCFGRRQLATLAIYICSLIPALLVDDVGPVLSIVGSLGASSVAYVAPGLVYLGVHGDEFIEMITSLLRNRQSKSSTSGTTVGELPLEGDAKAEMQSGLVSSSYKEMSKPWWWYPLLMPLWCSIASAGSISMREKIAESVEDMDAPLQSEKAMETEDEPLANPRDFCVAIFFVVFGVTAIFAGLASNAVVQLNNYLQYLQ
jgi:sodium-coupled neutral amino acid transporter 11